jgi:hypothetical protein
VASSGAARGGAVGALGRFSKCPTYGTTFAGGGLISGTQLYQTLYGRFEIKIWMLIPYMLNPPQHSLSSLCSSHTALLQARETRGPGPCSPHLITPIWKHEPVGVNRCFRRSTSAKTSNRARVRVCACASMRASVSLCFRRTPHLRKHEPVADRQTGRLADRQTDRQYNRQTE